MLSYHPGQIDTSVGHTEVQVSNCWSGHKKPKKKHAIASYKQIFRAVGLKDKF